MTGVTVHNKIQGTSSSGQRRYGRNFRLLRVPVFSNEGVLLNKNRKSRPLCYEANLAVLMREIRGGRATRLVLKNAMLAMQVVTEILGINSVHRLNTEIASKQFSLRSGDAR
jgi:hypothetical protein